MAITEIDDPKSWETDVLSSDKPVFVDFGHNGVDRGEW